MRIRKNFWLATIAIILSSTATTMAQDMKFGHVSVADIVLLMPEYKNISEVMESETAVLERQYTSMREELQNIEIEYENNFDSYTPAQRQAKEEEYAAMQQRVQEFFRNAQQSLQRKQEELQVPVLTKLQNAIEVVGEENGFLYIFEVNSGLTLFQSENSTNVTPLVKEELGL